VETLKKIAAYVARRRQRHRRRPRAVHDPEGKTAPRRCGRGHLRDRLVPDEASLARRCTTPPSPTSRLQRHDDARYSSRLHPPQAPNADIYLVVNTSQPAHRHHRDLRHHAQVRRRVGCRHRRHSGRLGNGAAHPPGAYGVARLRLQRARSLHAKPAPTDPAKQLADISNAGRSPSRHQQERRRSHSHRLDQPIPPRSTTPAKAVYSRDFTLAAAPPACLPRSEWRQASAGAPNSAPEGGPVRQVLGPDGLPNPLITRTGPGIHAYYDPPIPGGRTGDHQWPVRRCAVASALPPRRDQAASSPA
jgi:hypothetical protein